MWIVIVNDYYEPIVAEFHDEKEAKEFFDEWKNLTENDVYLTKVKEANKRG